MTRGAVTMDGMTENQQLFVLVIVVAMMVIAGLIYRAQASNSKRHEQEKQTALLEKIADKSER